MTLLTTLSADSTRRKRKPQAQNANLSSGNVEPDYRRYERLKSQLSPDLNPHEYIIAQECEL